MSMPHILLIEDTDSVREVITRQLEALGVRVTSLPNGDNVKRVLDQTPCDLVIADLHLPDCSGVDIARFAHAKQCKIVLVSGDHDVDTRPAVMAAGFDAILTKPITMDNLHALLLSQSLIATHPATQPSLLSDETGALDLVSLQEHMGDLDEVALSMLARFPDMMRPLVARISTLSEQGDVDPLVDVAHSLKGAARSAAAIELGDISETIQHNALHGVIEKHLAHKLETAFSKVETAIQRICA